MSTVAPGGAEAVGVPGVTSALAGETVRSTLEACSVTKEGKVNVARVTSMDLW